MDDIGNSLQNIDVIPLVIGGLISVVLTILIQQLGKRFLLSIIVSLKNKFFSKEQILGDFYGYYLHKDTPTSGIDFRVSYWRISADFRKEHYIVTIYDSPERKTEPLHYKGKMWVQGDHYLLRFDSKKYKETVFERKVKVTKVNKYPIVGIGLAITSHGKARANISIISKKKMSLAKFYKTVSDYKIVLEHDTFNLKIER